MVFNNIDALLSSIKSKWTVDGNKEKIKKQLRQKNRIQSGRLSGLMMSSAPIQSWKPSNRITNPAEAVCRVVNQRIMGRTEETRK